MRAHTREVLKDIAANLRALRLERDLTQAELAERAGYDDRFIQYIEAGPRNLTVDSLVAVADALGVSVDLLMRRADRSPVVRRRVRKPQRQKR